MDDTTGIEAGATLVPGDGGFTLVVGQQQPGATTCTGLAVATTPQTMTATALSPLATTPPATTAE